MDRKKNNDFISPTLAEAIGNEDPFSWQKVAEVIFRDVEGRKTSRIVVEGVISLNYTFFFWQGAFNDLIRG